MRMTNLWEFVLVYSCGMLAFTDECITERILKLLLCSCLRQTMSALRWPVSQNELLPLRVPVGGLVAFGPLEHTV
jgi:hypothetical protein